jgi:hypothetical protein
MDRNRTKRLVLQNTVLKSRATTSTLLRQQCASCSEQLPSDLAPFVKQVHQAAYRITDDQVRTVSATRSDHEIFEITIAAALGKAALQLDHALAMLDRAYAGDDVS